MFSGQILEFYGRHNAELESSFPDRQGGTGLQPDK